MKRRLLITLLVVIVVAGGYGIWCRVGRSVNPEKVDMRLMSVTGYGRDSGRGNIVGIQPYVRPSDYASKDRFYGMLDGYLREADRRGWLKRKTVVVFPEYVGTWLVVEGEKRGVYTSPTVDGAAKLGAASNGLSFLRAAMSARGSGRLGDALFRMKARRMAGTYDSVFSKLAREHHVTMVAGSILLPSPRVVGGRLTIGDGPLYNVSVLYGPDGKADGKLSIKAYPTSSEQAFMQAGKVDDLPVFDSPVGRLGVLVCADSWFPRAYHVMKRKGAETVVVTSFVAGDHEWESVWRGYDGACNCSDVRRSDIGKIKAREAWMKYALPGRLPKSGIANGMTVFLRGHLWDLGSDGATIVIRNGKATTAPVVDGAALVNLWL